jgi:hypothetical protein
MLYKHININLEILNGTPTFKPYLLASIFYLQKNTVVL